MKYLTLVAFVLLIIGCGKDNTDNPNYISLNEVDLTGTWLAENETKTFKTDTGEYLYSDFYEFKFVLEDTDIGVKYNRCEEYGGVFSPYGIKTDQHFYMNVTDNGFSMKKDGSLQQTTEYETVYRPGFNFESTLTLKKINDGVSLDNGTFVLNGPISNTEYDQVCVSISSANIGDSRTVGISVPFGNDSLSLIFNLRGDILPGTYQSANQDYSSPLRIEVSSNSDVFLSQINSYTLYPTNASVTVIESSPTIFSGTYTFLGPDQGDYSGEFEVIY